MRSRETLEDAIAQGFVTEKENTGPLSTYRKYWFYCCKNHIPFIKVRPKSRYVSLYIDLDSVSDPYMRLSKQGAAALEEVISTYNQRKYREMMGKAYEGSSFIYAYRIPLDLAAEAASECRKALQKEGSLSLYLSNKRL